MLSASFLDFVRSGGLRDYRNGRGSRREFSGASLKRSVPETCVTFIPSNMGNNALGKVLRVSLILAVCRLRGLLRNGRTCNPCLRNDLKFLSRCLGALRSDRARELADLPLVRLLRRGKNLKRTKARTPCERWARASLRRTLLCTCGPELEAPGGLEWGTPGLSLTAEKSLGA